MKLGMFERTARKLVTAKLRGLEVGSVRIVDRFDGAETWLGEPRDSASLRADLVVDDPKFYVDVMCRGTVGGAEAYAAGYWHSDDPIALVRIFVRNRAVLDAMEGGAARLSAPLLRGFHRLRNNTQAGAKKNIAAHYDLGNDFFEQFLDPTMTYSSALFERPDMTLEQASIAKLDRLCRSLDLKPSDHLVEIGTGWGSMAMHAAEHYGCRVTTTTISHAQFELARERIEARGLGDRIELLERDYRELEGQYDKLVSVEMIEAVGAPFLGEYMRKCSDLLKPDGAAALQIIAIQDQNYEQALRDVDFIKRYIFPGSFIPSIHAVSQAMVENTDLRMLDMVDLGPHYAETLERWRDNLHASRERILALDGPYDETFLRLWDYYLCYCAGGFRERFLGVAQVVFRKPLSTLESIPLPRAARTEVELPRSVRSERGTTDKVRSA